MKYLRESKMESTHKKIHMEHLRVGVVMINTEQDNSNAVLFSTIF